MKRSQGPASNIFEVESMLMEETRRKTTWLSASLCLAGWLAALERGKRRWSRVRQRRLPAGADSIQRGFRLENLGSFTFRELSRPIVLPRVGVGQPETKEANGQMN